MITVNTKHLSEALSLGIINANVSTFHRKSSLAQLTISDDTLTINVEASMLSTEIKLHGYVSETDESSTVFVDNLLLKQLISTLSSDVVELSIQSDGLLIRSGKSTYTLPKVVDDVDFSLQRPSISIDDISTTTIDRSGWKFIKDHQMFAVATDFSYPVYRNVWVSEDGDVLTGDFDISLFTHSVVGDFETTCLLSDTIINLFNSLPEGSKLGVVDRKYIIGYRCDGFEYTTEFEPQYEDTGVVGYYHADIILPILEHPENFNVISVDSVNKLLNQASLLSNGITDDVSFGVSNNTLMISNTNVKGQIPVEGSESVDYTLAFKLDTLKKIFKNYSAQVNVGPLIQDDEITGIILWDDDLTTVLAGVE